VALKRALRIRASSLAMAKQERRGGIETEDQQHTQQQDKGESRNAVVALKPRSIQVLPHTGNMKAGTPWWH